MKEMFGPSMIILVAKDAEVDEVLIDEARGIAKELAGQNALGRIRIADKGSFCYN